jgi:hypothetical protein
MGLATLRRRPALLIFEVLSVGLLITSWTLGFSSQNRQKIKNPHFHGSFLDFLERAMGLEPTTAAMARRYSSQLSYAREDWYEGILYIFLKNQEFSILLPFSSLLI